MNWLKMNQYFCTSISYSMFFFAELMVLGFISLLLTFGQSYIAKICIPEKAADTMLPCNLRKETDEEDHDGSSKRRLLWSLATNSTSRRILAADVPSSCGEVSKIFYKLYNLLLVYLLLCWVIVSTDCKGQSILSIDLFHFICVHDANAKINCHMVLLGVDLASRIWFHCKRQ